jgi:hypothetical protein
MFRDRVVSMEQTLEGGEKHLALLTDICREAFPDLAYSEHGLDHERDLFVMELSAPDGRRTKVCWTRMVLFDAERIPTLTAEPASQLRAKIVEFLRAHGGHPEIVVTFRHLEEGWVDTPEPRREGRRRRRGGRGGGKGHDRGAPARKPHGARPGAPARGAAGGATVAPRPAAAAQRPPAQGEPGREASGSGEAAAGSKAGGRRRRRFRRRRRGRGQGGGAAGAGSPAPEKS